MESQCSFGLHFPARDFKRDFSVVSSFKQVMSPRKVTEEERGDGES